MQSAFDATRFNWNKNYDTDGVVRLHIRDFMLTYDDGTLAPLLLENVGRSANTHYRLTGTLVDPLNPDIGLPHVVCVSAYVVDFGRNEQNDEVQGFWMTGEDPDRRYKLVYPCATSYQNYASGILDLASDRSLLKYYLHSYERVPSLQLTDFSLTDDALGTSQTLILPTKTRAPFLLKGLIKLNAAVYCADGMERLSEHGDYSQLRVQTYVHSNYFVDFGRDAQGNADPEFWVEDCFHTWIRLVTPCHPSYLSDFTHTMKQTILNVQGYNWASEEDQIWRRVTNFRLTDLTGALHHLDITQLGSQFILWGDLLPPPTSSQPVISIKLYVGAMAIDIGRELDDPNKGVWLSDIRGDWYMLVPPAAPEFRAIAYDLLNRAANYLALYDALVYNDPDEKISVYDEDTMLFTCQMKIREVHRQAPEPKFDLQFVAEHADFVLHHLQTNFDLERSTTLVNSIARLREKLCPTAASAPPPTGKKRSIDDVSSGSAQEIDNSTTTSGDSSSNGSANADIEAKRQRGEEENSAAADITKIMKTAKKLLSMAPDPVHGHNSDVRVSESSNGHRSGVTSMMGPEARAAAGTHKAKPESFKLGADSVSKSGLPVADTRDLMKQALAKMSAPLTGPATNSIRATGSMEKAVAGTHGTSTATTALTSVSGAASATPAPVRMIKKKQILTEEGEASPIRETVERTNAPRLERSASGSFTAATSVSATPTPVQASVSGNFTPHPPWTSHCDTRQDRSQSHIVEVPCNYCRQRRKHFKCHNARHEDGQLVKLRVSGPPPPHATTARAAPEDHAPATPRTLALPHPTVPLRYAVNPLTLADSGDHGGAPSERVLPPMASIPLRGDCDALAEFQRDLLEVEVEHLALKTKRNNVDYDHVHERRMYQKHAANEIPTNSSERASPSEEGEIRESNETTDISTKPADSSMAYLTSLQSVHKPGWGRIAAASLSRSSGATSTTPTGISVPMEATSLVKLGGREDDPKKRMDMSTTRSVGVYLPQNMTVANGCSLSWKAQAVRAAPRPMYVYDASARPTKSILKGTSVSNTKTVERKVLWTDGSLGKELISFVEIHDAPIGEESWIIPKSH